MKFFLFSGRTGEVANVRVEDISKDSATILWDPPSVLRNNQPAQLTYQVSVCRDNACQNFNVTPAERKVVVQNLLEFKIYTYNIVTYNSLGKAGPAYNNTFETLENEGN